MLRHLPRALLLYSVPKILPQNSPPLNCGFSPLQVPGTEYGDAGRARGWRMYLKTGRSGPEVGSSKKSDPERWSTARGRWPEPHGPPFGKSAPKRREERGLPADKAWSRGGRNHVFHDKAECPGTG